MKPMMTPQITPRENCFQFIARLTIGESSNENKISESLRTAMLKWNGACCSYKACFHAGSDSLHRLVRWYTLRQIMTTAMSAAITIKALTKKSQSYSTFGVSGQ